MLVLVRFARSTNLFPVPENLACWTLAHSFVSPTFLFHKQSSVHDPVLEKTFRFLVQITLVVKQGLSESEIPRRR